MDAPTYISNIEGVGEGLKASSSPHVGTPIGSSYKRLLIISTYLILLCTGYGQGTEQFIPIGQSPGVSGKLSIQGLIKGFDPATTVLRFSVCTQHSIVDMGMLLALIEQGRAEAVCLRHGRLPAGTVIYLDRSHLHKPNHTGSYGDLKPDREMEWYPNHWLKVRVEE